VADLDMKALEAARDMLRSCKDHREDWLAKCITAYLSALPPVVGGDVAEMVKRLEKEAAFIIGMPGGREMYATITEAAAMLEALSQSREAADNRLFNLLARIHRDGGHYLGEHGIEKACADADEKVAWLHVHDDEREADRVRARNEGIEMAACLAGENGDHDSARAIRALKEPE